MSPHSHHPPPPYETSSSHHHPHPQHHHHQPKIHHGHGHHGHHGHHGFDHHIQRDTCHCIGVCVCNRQPLSHFPQPPHLHYHTFPTNPIHHQIHITGHPSPVVNTVLVRRSRFNLCGFLFFLAIVSTFICLIVLSSPHFDNWIQRHERIKRRHEQGVAWSTAIPGPCLRSGVRQYSATLLRYPTDNYWKEACETTEFYIHGRQLAPTRCELTSFIFGHVIGHWEVGYNEPQCTPVWSSATDEGCSGPGERRFSARILNVDNPEQWEIVCAKTPLEIRGITRLPQECSNKGLLGMWGHWNISDENCYAL